MAEPLIIIPGDEDQARGYRVGKWKQYPLYLCLYCKFSTIYLEGKKGMQAHQKADNHPWPYGDGSEEEELQPEIETVPEY